MTAPFGPESDEVPREALDVDDGSPADEPEGGALRDHTPPSRRRKILKRLGIGLGGLIVLYLLLFTISWLMVDARGDVEFFEGRPGEHRPLVFAHQGGEGNRPSNTMIAFRESIEIGADVLDSDVHMTRDGELVLIHDETVDATTNGSGEVRDLTLVELRELDFGYRFSTDGGETFPYRDTGVGIVTVDELFAEFPDTRFGFEIKQTTPDAATKLCALIQEYGYEGRVLLSSSGQENMDAFRDSCPSVATSATDGEATRFYIFQFVRLSGFYSPPFDSLQVPEYRGGTHVLTGSFVGAARRWNLPVVPWTINEPEDLDRIISDFDVDGINTDYPDRLIEYLEE
ncbi:MAG: glycerophosphodiester phosphodiesterase [Acidimicrobiales bacterium]|nr:glycerophosphodiester phosphodiesterase [Acidimicrobiales bacterium]